jgi:hypothetical protein
MNVDYFFCLLVESLVSQADEKIKIHVVVSEPELRFESEGERCATSLPFKFFNKSLVAGLAFRAMDSSRSSLIF